MHALALSQALPSLLCAQLLAETMNGALCMTVPVTLNWLGAQLLAETMNGARRALKRGVGEASRADIQDGFYDQSSNDQNSVLSVLFYRTGRPVARFCVMVHLAQSLVLES